MINRMDEIKRKGFNMTASRSPDQRYNPTDFSKIRVGLQSLSDAIVTYGSLQETNARLGNKSNVLKAINDNDIETMRQISNFFYA